MLERNPAPIYLDDCGRVKKRDLAQNDIGAKGATQVARALEANPTLTQLNLMVSDIGDEGATQLARALKST